MGFCENTQSCDMVGMIVGYEYAFYRFGGDIILDKRRHKLFAAYSGINEYSAGGSANKAGISGAGRK